MKKLIRDLSVVFALLAFVASFSTDAKAACGCGGKMAPAPNELGPEQPMKVSPAASIPSMVKGTPVAKVPLAPNAIAPAGTACGIPTGGAASLPQSVWMSSILPHTIQLNSKAPGQIRVSQILVPNASTAFALRNEILRGGSFTEAAQRYSTDTSAPIGGELGYISRGETTPVFENIAFNLPEGQLSQPFKTQYGWHLILVTDKT